MSTRGGELGDGMRCIGRRNPGKSVWIASVCLLLSCAFSGCGGDRDHGTYQGVSVGGVRNCLFIVLDATRARNLSLLGYERETTPFIDALAKESTYFEAAYSQATSTSPSAWSYLTGRYPYWPESGSAFLVKKGDRLLSEIFNDAGFRTGGFSENPYVRERYGFDKGFDQFEYVPYFHSKPESYDYSATFDPRPSKRVVEEAKNWMQSVLDKNWFCYVHLLRPHTPYTAPEPFAARFLSEAGQDVEALRAREAAIMDRFFSGQLPRRDELTFLVALYDANLVYADSLVRELVTFLQEKGVLEDTLVIVASDHGESFLEHGRLLHSSTPYDELLHVPLIIRAPAAAGFRLGPVSQAVELLDLMPTLEDIFGIESAGKLDGMSLLPLLRGEQSSHKKTLFAENFDTRSVSVRRGRLKLVVVMDETLERFEAPSLYDLSEDPLETRNVFEEREIAGELLRSAAAYVRTRSSGAAVSASELSEAEQEELRALGYVE